MVSVMKEYVVEVEDLDVSTPRFSCLVGYRETMSHVVQIIYLCLNLDINYLQKSSFLVQYFSWIHSHGPGVTIQYLRNAFV